MTIARIIQAMRKQISRSPSWGPYYMDAMFYILCVASRSGELSSGRRNFNPNFRRLS